MALSARVVWVDLGWREGAQPPSFSGVQGIDFSPKGLVLRKFYSQRSRNGKAMYARNGSDLTPGL